MHGLLSAIVARTRPSILWPAIFPALSAPFAGNLDADGCYLSSEQLRTRWLELLAGTAPADTIMYCGSGVSAVHNLIALEHAGLGSGKLYVGSWSEWIMDPARPVATGSDLWGR